MSGIFELGLMFVVVGAKGFTKGGLPFSSRSRIVGKWGRVVGGLCLLIGVLAVALAFWAGAPAERQSLRTFCFGVAAGVLGTVSVLVNWQGEGDQVA